MTVSGRQRGAFLARWCLSLPSFSRGCSWYVWGGMQGMCGSLVLHVCRYKLREEVIRNGW